MKVKICGLFRSIDIAYANAARPEYIGFVFAKSKRQITIEQAITLRQELAEGITPVGVFVNAPVKQVAELLNKGTIAIAQLHGIEDNDYIKDLRSLTEGQKIIKAIRVQTQEDILINNQSEADYLLLDAYTPMVEGGTGIVFDWNIIKQVEKPFLLAGGINIGNIEAAMRTEAFALDISSGVETEGVKDKKKIMEIIKKVRGNNKE